VDDARHELLEAGDEILVGLERDRLVAAGDEIPGDPLDQLEADFLAVRLAEEIDDVLAVAVVDDGDLYGYLLSEVPIDFPLQGI